MLEILILNINANVICIMFKSNVIGVCSPKLWLYDSHQSQSTLDANYPNNPPTTSPDKININNIHIFFSFVAIFSTSKIPLLLTAVYFLLH